MYRRLHARKLPAVGACAGEESEKRLVEREERLSLRKAASEELPPGVLSQRVKTDDDRRFVPAGLVQALVDRFSLGRIQEQHQSVAAPCFRTEMGKRANLARLERLHAEPCAYKPWYGRVKRDLGIGEAKVS